MKSDKRLDDDIRSRREFLLTGAGAVAAPLIAGMGSSALAQSAGQTAGDQSASQPRTPRQLGSLSVPELVLGCMGMSNIYGLAGTKEESIALIRAAFGRGGTVFETAELYGPYTNWPIRQPVRHGPSNDVRGCCVLDRSKFLPTIHSRRGPATTGR